MDKKEKGGRGGASYGKRTNLCCGEGAAVQGLPEFPARLRGRVLPHQPAASHMADPGSVSAPAFHSFYFLDKQKGLRQTTRGQRITEVEAEG